MKNKELFDSTINVLVKAYQNDTLKHGDCTACAVGNICAQYAPSISLCSNISDSNASWKALFYTDCGAQVFNVSQEENWTKKAKDLVNKTGYTIDELAKIEFSFETGTGIYKTAEEKMFNGLMSVVDVLLDIHEVNKNETDFFKSLFVKETA